MGNLGRYQEIVELAKRSGGVDAMLDVVKKGAVEDAAPKLIGVGVAAGAALTVGTTRGPGWVRQALVSRRERIQRAQAAEQELREALDAHQSSERFDARATEASDPASCNNNRPESSEDNHADRA